LKLKELNENNTNENIKRKRKISKTMKNNQKSVLMPEDIYIFYLKD
jgi:hypothetical protein